MTDELSMSIEEYHAHLALAEEESPIAGDPDWSADFDDADGAE